MVTRITNTHRRNKDKTINKPFLKTVHNPGEVFVFQLNNLKRNHFNKISLKSPFLIYMFMNEHVYLRINVNIQDFLLSFLHSAHGIKDVWSFNRQAMVTSDHSPP